MAAGTAFAISYTSDLSSVTPENLVVFTVLYQYVGVQFLFRKCLLLNDHL